LLSGSPQEVSFIHSLIRPHQCLDCNQPPGVRITFEPNSGIASFDSTLTVTASEDVPTGSFDIYIVASAGGNYVLATVVVRERTTQTMHGEHLPWWTLPSVVLLAIAVVVALFLGTRSYKRSKSIRDETKIY
jgi:hypothetical protein